MSKTIFITSFHGLISRNIISTGILKLLQKQGFSIVILVPCAKESFFVKAFQSEHVTIRAVEYAFGAREKFLKYLSLATVNTATLKIKRKTEMKGSGSIVSYIIGNKYGRTLARYIEEKTYNHQIYSKLFDEYKPEAIFVTDIQGELDVSLLHEAKKRKINRIGMVRSWDNLTSKGLIRSIPEKLLVWNEIVLKEATVYHDVPASQITIIGIPHYDDYINKKQDNKETFFNEIGADIAKKLMLVVPIGDRYLENNTVDRDIVHFLTEILPLDWQILVRFPPGDYVREIERNTTQFGRINVLYDRASQPFENIKMTEITHTDDQRLIETIQSADLVVSGPSTMVIDAAFLGKPTILFGFDGYEKRNYLTSIRRYYDYDNFAPILRSGGARLAESKQEFEKLVHEYIKDPSKDEQGRRALALAEATWMDGQSTERLLQALVG